jgi:branched-chain amino acid transport system permease protein
MYDGRIERPVEYGILVTFGLAFTLMYFVQAVAGSNPVKAKRFFDFPRIRFPSKEDPWLIKTSRGNMELFDTISISNPRFIAAVISILVLVRAYCSFFIRHGPAKRFEQLARIVRQQQSRESILIE